MKIHPNKLFEIYEECLKVRHKTHLSRRAFQSLLGKLLYIQKCVKPSQIFIIRILALFGDSPGEKVRSSKIFI